MNDKFHIRHSPVFVYIFLAFSIFSSYPAFGQISFTNAGETIRITGHYSFAFKNRTPGFTNNFHYVVLTTSGGWLISATNDNNSSDWGVMRYDGTNIYMIGTYVGNQPSGFTNAFRIYGYVFSGRFYFPEIQDSTHLFLPWMAFHLSPQMIKDSSTRDGVIEIPWPWGNPRFSPGGYGYKWILKSDDAAQIIQNLEIVRDTALDLKTEDEELRRATLDYPFTMSQRDQLLIQLSFRKSVPNDFVQCSYECTGVKKPNGVSIPSAAHFVEYFPDMKSKDKILLFEYALITDNVELLRENCPIDIVIPAKAFIFDYRYQMTNIRTKYNYANYTLDAGDRFRSDKDPKLLAEALEWLKHGPGYDSYKSKRKIILAGMVIVTILSSLTLYLFQLRGNQKHKL
jgi:hypothetical protein